MDYYHRKGDPSIRENELIATLSPRKTGKDGIDVYGDVVPAKQSSEATLKALSQVYTEVKENQTYYYAATNGRVRCTGNQVEVDNEYVIQSDVGRKTGNITHAGSVVVQGDITPGSSVQVEGDLDVHGTVEHADIDVGGNLMVQEGITGNGYEPIRVRSTVTVRYLRNTEIHAGKDVTILNESITSTVYTRGRIELSNGRFSGGEAIALQGGTINELGSEGDTITTFKTAVDPYLEESTQESYQKAKQGETHVLGTVFPETYIQVDDTPLERIEREWHGPLRIIKAREEEEEEGEEEEEEKEGYKVKFLYETESHSHEDELH